LSAAQVCALKRSLASAKTTALLTLFVAAFAASVPSVVAQTTPKATVDTSETMFAVLAGMNACGYDQDLEVSNPLRKELRAEITKAIDLSAQATEAERKACAFYRDHRASDPGRDLAQYVSLALYMSSPPTLGLTVKDSELPPDASYVQGFVPLLQAMYSSADLHSVWQRHRSDYDALIERYHEPITKLLLDTDLYLRIPFSGFVGRKFTILLEPLGAPNQINARNYGLDYYLMISPAGDNLKLQEIRHTYLHYVLDPMALKRPMAMKQLEPLELTVANAPMDKSFKNDVSLLVTESLIQAIEARIGDPSSSKIATLPLKSGATREGHPDPGLEAERLKKVQAAEEQGFVLTRYFYDQLAQFEKGPTGLQDAYPDWLYAINVDQQRKHAENIVYARQAAPEVVHASKPTESLLERAERQLATGDPEGAQQSAEQAIAEKQGDLGHAYFVLAKVATMNKDIVGARKNFEQSLQLSHEPRVVAWSHIYLGRIYDLQENREAALGEYRAALKVNDLPQEIKAAAERGIKQAYEPPKHEQ
jgi:hypothetical protein